MGVLSSRVIASLVGSRKPGEDNDATQERGRHRNEKVKNWTKRKLKCCRVFQERVFLNRSVRPVGDAHARRAHVGFASSCCPPPPRFLFWSGALFTAVTLQVAG